MKKFEIGTYRTYAGTSEVRYWIEKVTEKTVTVTIQDRKSTRLNSSH